MENSKENLYIDSGVLRVIGTKLQSIKGNGKNFCTWNGPTVLQKDEWSVHVPTSPLLRRWFPVGRAPTLSGVETEKKFKSCGVVFLAVQASCTQH